MTDLAYLRDLLIMLVVAVLVVAALNRFRIPTITGFILAGVIVGPGALGIIGDPNEVELLSEVGVALLLFGIGLELSLDRLKRLWRAIIIGGSLQVGITILTSSLIAETLGFSINVSILIGCLLAVSSTAIVLHGLEQRGEADAPHGRLTLGILVFQDLLVVPMILLVPILSGAEASIRDIAETFLRAAAIVGGVMIAARLIVPHILRYIVKTRQRQLFLLTVLLVCIGTAWLTSMAGVSLALGAFLAGLVVAGSDYRQQALADLIPFKEVFTSIFFISVGMMLSLHMVLTNIIPIALLLLAILIGKSVIVFLIGLFMRLPLRVAILAGAALAQVGEFSFVVSKTAQKTGLLSDSLNGTILPAITLSMFITPFALSLGPHIAAMADKSKMLTRFWRKFSAEETPEALPKLRDHVVIGGYGFTGEKLAASLKACGIPYLIIELNPANIERALNRGDQAYYGDITNRETLKRLKLTNASALVLVINDPNALERATRDARETAPNLHIVVRARYLQDVKRLVKAGASEVVSSELEAAIEITSSIVNRYTPALAKRKERLSDTIRQKWLNGE